MAGGVKQAKSVSWAPGVKLCQVRLFLSEDAPFLSGSDAQDHLQARPSSLWHLNTMASDESLPPGFEGFNPINQLQMNFSQIPLIQWLCPCKLVLNSDWLVVAGEESEEVEFQNRRQLGVLEAIYPRSSSIPSDPSVSSDVQDSHYDDEQTTFVPITAIEDEEWDLSCQPSTANASTLELANILQPMPGPVPMPTRCDSQQLHASAMQTTSNLPFGGTPALSFAPGKEADVAAAAAAAFTAIMHSSDQGSLIDRELLIKILSDPKMIEKLVPEHGGHKQGSIRPLVPSAVPSVSAPPASAPSPPVQIHYNVPSPGLQGHIHPAQNLITTQLLSHPTVEGPPGKNLNNSMVQDNGLRDVTYYQNLIQQHGGEERDMMDNSPLQFRKRQGNDMDRGMHDLKQRDTRARVAKPCAYFNAPKGCKHGSNCLYLHDSSLPQRIERGGKRIKLDR